jgi:hypothetical protein
MNRAQIAAILILLSVFLLTANAYGQVKKQIRRDSKIPRSAAFYNGKNFRYDYRAGILARAEMDARIRDLMWTCWTEQRKCKVSGTVYSIEGDPTKTVFAVEKDRYGRPFLKIKVVTTWGFFFWDRGKETIASNYHDLDRVEPMVDASSPEIPKPIPFHAARGPHDYRLRFKAEMPKNDFLF